MVAVCQARACHAMALPKSSAGTRLGMIAWLAGLANARLTPNTRIRA